MKKTIKLNANQRLAAIQRIAIIAIAAVMALAFTTCEGAEGPMGPQGPAGGQGPEGPQGPTGGDPDCPHYYFSSWVTNIIPENCTEKNKDGRVCMKCGYEEHRDGAIYPLGHQLSNLTITTQPTETADGHATGDCTRVGCATPTGINHSIPAWNKYYGTWKGRSSINQNDVTIIIDKNNFKLDGGNATSDHLYFSISSWGTVGLNTDATQSNKDAIPFYQQITGTTTSLAGYNSTTTISVGLNVNGTLSVSTFGGTSLSASNYGNFVKQ
jgi:hypothetical protein